MPKIKTNKTARKRFRTNAKGAIKRRRAYKSHNTAKKTPKRRRQLRGTTMVDKSNIGLVKRLLRYIGKNK